MNVHVPQIILSVALPLTWAFAAPHDAKAEEATIEGPKSSEQHKLPDGTVRFKTGSSEITLDSARQLDRIAAFVRNQPDGDVLVVGHTDRHGDVPSNLALSRQRARRIKDELVRRNVRPTRIKVLGVGESEHLSHEPTIEADALNRRVEVWVGTREAIAVVSWIYRTVQAQKPAVKDWDPAYLQMELRRLFRVRTVGQSAGEVTFTEGHRLYLGPEAYMVVYGRDARARRDKPRVADVTLDEGTLLASLASRGRRVIAVKTDAARMRLSQTKKTRIASNKAKAQSTVSVYDGRADVSAQGESVQVNKGYGTRVKNGLPPEAPAPLPPAPEWTSPGPATIFSGLPSPTLRWITRSSAPRAVLEIGDYQDPEIRRPLRIHEPVAEGAPILTVEPGRYWLRVTSVSERDVVGRPSIARELRVLPAPEPIEGPGFELEGTTLVMTYPGIVRLNAPAGRRTEWRLDGGPVQREAYLAPGEHTLSCRTTDAAGQVAEGLVLIRVEPLQLGVENVGTPTLDGIDSVTPIELMIKDYRGRPIDGLDLVAASPDPLRGVGDFDASGPGPMNPVEAPLGATARAKANGGGNYRLRHRDFAPPVEDKAVVVVYERHSRTGRLLEVPMAGTNQISPRKDPARRTAPLSVGLYAGLMGGIMREVGGEFGPSVRGEAGVVLTQGLLRLTLGVDGGFTSLSTRNNVGTLSLFPVNAKATFALRLASVRPYIGLAGGARIQNLSRNDGVPETVTADDVSENLVGILGAAWHWQGLEAFAEGRYGKMDIPGTGLGQVANGPTFYLGLRYFLTDG